MNFLGLSCLISELEDFNVISDLVNFTVAKDFVSAQRAIMLFGLVAVESQI